MFYFNFQLYNYQFCIIKAQVISGRGVRTPCTLTPGVRLCLDLTRSRRFGAMRWRWVEYVLPPDRWPHQNGRLESLDCIQHCLNLACTGGVREEGKYDSAWEERKRYTHCVFLPPLLFPLLCLPWKYSTSLFKIAILDPAILDGVGSFERIRKVRFYDNQKDMLGVLITCLGLHNIAELFYRQGAFPKC